MPYHSMFRQFRNQKLAVPSVTSTLATHHAKRSNASPAADAANTIATTKRMDELFIFFPSMLR